MEVIEAHKKKKKKSKWTDESFFTTKLISIAYQNRLCDLFRVFLECIMSQLVCETGPGSTS